jgi:phosphoglucomutase
MLEPTIQEKVNSWLSGAYDEETKTRLRQLQSSGNEEELADAFYRDLEFGTGGLRGIMGIGSNRMNRYTVGKATQGLSNYLMKCFPNEQVKVAVAFDSRNQSPELAKVVQDVFSANGIIVYCYRELRPTPLLSYTIRKMQCHSGVVLTASHNPKEYNGYKAYWQDGAQLTEPHDQRVMDEVANITDLSQVKFDRKEENIRYLDQEVEEAYLQQVMAQAINREAINRNRDVKIVYTPLHGTGITLVPKVLEQLGFNAVHIVEAQAVPDGNFPTVVYPNPEEQEAMSMALKEAAQIDADLVLATDPDADRVGIAVKDTAADWVLLNGNQTGVLIMYYLLRARKEAGLLTHKDYLVKTVVTTDLIDQIAASYGVNCYNTLTGFKYIASIMREREGRENYIAGCEESYGYLIGDFVRDKDAVSACAMIAEIAAFARDQKKSVYELLLDIYQEFGFYQEYLISITRKGRRGAEEISEMMQGYRQNPPQTLGGSKVKELIDYKTGTHRDLISGKESAIDFPASNVLQFVTEDGTKVSARPSGTEPKIKFYVSSRADLKNAADLTSAKAKLDEKLLAIRKDLGV